MLPNLRIESVHQVAVQQYLVFSIWQQMYKIESRRRQLLPTCRPERLKQTVADDGDEQLPAESLDCSTRVLGSEQGREIKHGDIRLQDRWNSFVMSQERIKLGEIYFISNSEYRN
mgnify:CR=1 FL=1